MTISASDKVPQPLLPEECANGPTRYAPKLKQCKRPPEVWAYGKFYCKECADEITKKYRSI